MLKRRLGHTEIQVSAMGLGCWAIGGPMKDLKHPHVASTGWGQVDDAESIRAIHRGLDLGINFFDTANAYGCGHSERILGQALAGRREQVIIATKFGKVIDERARLFAARPPCAAVQHALHVFSDPERTDSLLSYCEEYDLAGVNRI